MQLDLEVYIMNEIDLYFFTPAGRVPIPPDSHHGDIIPVNVAYSAPLLVHATLSHPPLLHRQFSEEERS